MSGQEEWVWLWLENKLEVGYGGADPLSEAMFYAFHHTKGKDRTGLLLPSLVVEQFGPFLRYRALTFGPCTAVSVCNPNKALRSGSCIKAHICRVLV